MKSTTTVELACIIDDDKVYVNLVKKIIETKKLCENLMVFRDGKQSIDYFEALMENMKEDRIPEIIFLDLNMPVMDGWEFLERFTKIKNKFNKVITLYVVSSSINPLDVRRAKSLSSVKDYLIKPINITELENIFCKPTEEI
jgi:CheY-like chemotaxis protein